MTLGRNGFEPGYDGHIDAQRTAFVDKGKELLVVEKHLGDDVVGSGIDLGFEHFKVVIERGRLHVFFGVSGHSDAKVGGGSVFEAVVEVAPAVEGGDLGDQF